MHWEPTRNHEGVGLEKPKQVPPPTKTPFQYVPCSQGLQLVNVLFLVHSWEIHKYIEKPTLCKTFANCNRQPAYCHMCAPQYSLENEKWKHLIYYLARIRVFLFTFPSFPSASRHGIAGTRGGAAESWQWSCWGQLHCALSCYPCEFTFGVNRKYKYITCILIPFYQKIRGNTLSKG